MSKRTATQCDTSRGSNRGSVVVVGGGLAGLTATKRLIDEGYDPMVLEAASRVGGRVHTLHHGDQHVEKGPMRIPEDHKRVMELVQELGLRLRPFVQLNHRGVYRLRGERHAIGEWPLVQTAYRRDQVWANPHPLHQYQEIMKYLFATKLWEKDRPHARAADLGGSERLIELRSKSLRQVLEDEASDGERLWTPETIDHVLDATGMSAYDGYDACEIILESEALQSNKRFEIVEGMDALTTRLTNLVGRERIRLNCQVTAVRVAPHGRGLVVQWSSPDGPQEQHFDYGILAIPAPAAHQIEFTPPLPTQQASALLNVNYAPALKSLVYFDRRHFETLLGIYGGISVVDHAQLVLPSDNARPLTVASGTALDHPVSSPRGGLRRTERVHYGARSRELSEGPGFIAVYLWDEPARRIINRSAEGRNRYAYNTIRSAFGPVIADGIAHVEHAPWPEAFRHDRPGDWLKYEGALHMPYPLAHPLVWWAGEHLGAEHGWMESAIQSGLDAADALDSRRSLRGPQAAA